MDLTEWTVNYVKYKDIRTKQLKGFELNDGSVEFHFKDGKKLFLICENLDDAEVKENCTVVCLNTEANLKTLLNKWNDYKETSFTIIFANPERNEKWIIRPSIHSRIADPESLGQGLRSMFDQVPEV